MTAEKQEMGPTVGPIRPPAVLVALNGVMRDIVAAGGIGKGKQNQQQGWKYRGIEQLMDELGPLFAEHALIVLPSYTDRICESRETAKGGTLYSVTLRARFRFMSCLDGSFVECEVVGEAMDSADKATNKAMSVALKYALSQTLSIPFEVDDQEAETHPPTRPQTAKPETAKSKAKPAPSKGTPIDRQRESIVGLMALLNYEWKDVREMVREITGRDLSTYESARASLTPDERAKIMARLDEILADREERAALQDPE